MPPIVRVFVERVFVVRVFVHNGTSAVVWRSKRFVAVYGLAPRGGCGLSILAYRPWSEATNVCSFTGYPHGFPQVIHRFVHIPHRFVHSCLVIPRFIHISTGSAQPMPTRARARFLSCPQGPTTQSEIRLEELLTFSWLTLLAETC